MAKRTAKTTPPKGNSNKPWVANYPPLQVWLHKHEARCMWQWPCGEPPSDPDDRYDWTPCAYVECYLVRTKLVIVVVHANRNGWEIYTAPDALKVDETLAEVERRIGIAE